MRGKKDDVVIGRGDTVVDYRRGAPHCFTWGLSNPASRVASMSKQEYDNSEGISWAEHLIATLTSHHLHEIVFSARSIVLCDKHYAAISYLHCHHATRNSDS